MKRREIFTAIELSEFVEGKAYELIHSGMIYSEKYGEFEFTKEDLQTMADNFNSNVLDTEVAVDINHDPEKKAYAWIKPQSMYVAPSLMKQGEYSLYGELYRYTSEGEKLVSEGAYRYFSLEIRPTFKKIVDGAVRVYRNVISGLALTNSPVYKGLSPTFSEHLLDNTDDMNAVNLYLSSLTKKEVVTRDEKDLLAEMTKTLSEEEAESIKADVESVEAKPEDKEEPATDEAEAKEDPSEEASEEAAEEATEEEEKAEEAGTESEEVEGAEEPSEESKAAEEPAEETEEKQLSEDAKSMELSERVQYLETELRKKNLSEEANAFLLSEEKKIGFNKGSQESLVEFMVSLSEEQLSTFKTLFSQIRTVDFSEHGGIDPMEMSEEDKHMKAKTLAKQIEKDEGLASHYALSEAYKRLNLAQ